MLAILISDTSRIKAAGLTNMSITGLDFTSTTVGGVDASSIATSTAVDDAGGATISLVTATNLTDGNFVIRIEGFEHTTTPDPSSDLSFGSGTTTGCSGTIVDGPTSGEASGVITYDFSIQEDVTGCAGSSTIEIDIDPNILTSVVNPGNYKITLTVDSDYGAFFVYVGSANQVIVNASVSGSISFNIVAPDYNSSTTSACSLGVLSTTGVSTCSYRLTVGSNAQNGFNIYAKSDGVLSTGPNGSGDTIANTADGVINAGTEEYGANIAIGTALTDTGTTSSTATFNVNSGFTTNNYNALPTTPTLIATAAGTNNPSNNSHTLLMTHSASISSSTLTGNYSQVIDFYVNGSF